MSVSAQVGCSWAAQSSVGWIAITAGANGNGTVHYSVEMNNGPAAREGAITIAGMTFTAMQAGIITGVEEKEPLVLRGFELWQT